MFDISNLSQGIELVLKLTDWPMTLYNRDRLYKKLKVIIGTVNEHNYKIYKNMSDE